MGKCIQLIESYAKKDNDKDVVICLPTNISYNSNSSDRMDVANTLLNIQDGHKQFSKETATNRIRKMSGSAGSFYQKLANCESSSNDDFDPKKKIKRKKS